MRLVAAIIKPFELDDVREALTVLRVEGVTLTEAKGFGRQKVLDLGYLYVIAPAGVGATIMLVIALVVDNIRKRRRYPEFWI